MTKYLITITATVTLIVVIVFYQTIVQALLFVGYAAAALLGLAGLFGLFFGGWYLVERIKMIRATRIEAEKQGNVLALANEHGVFIRETDKKAVWFQLHQMPQWRINGTPQEPTPAELATYRDFLASRHRAALPTPASEIVIEAKPIDLLELIDAYPHTLAWGGSGNGKTSLLRAIAYRRKLQGHRVLILDSREHPIKWQGLDRMETPEKIGRAIHILFRILNQNVEALRTGQATESDFEKITIVTDEWTEIVAENDTAKAFIATMVRQSRKYGIHLVFATQTNLSADLGLDGRYKIINGFLQLELKKRPDGTHVAAAVVANQKLGEFSVPIPPPLPQMPPTAGYISPSLDLMDEVSESEAASVLERKEVDFIRLVKEGATKSEACWQVYKRDFGGTLAQKLNRLLASSSEGAELEDERTLEEEERQEHKL
ncbi:MAG: hypothetical protein HS126_18765 [Anaerolineales bacterium]|nr:hypothetical protein [Anaerolineales bacterium]